MQLHQVCIQILHIFKLAPAVLAHRHDVAHILIGADDGNLDKRLLRNLNGRGVGIVVGVVHGHHRAVGLGNVVDHRGQGGHKVQVKFPLQPLLNDLHMEHSQKAAAKTKAQRRGGFRLKGEGRIVQLELFQRIPQVRVFGPVLGVNAAVHHGLRRTIAGQRLGGGLFRPGDGVAHPGILHIFHAGGKITDLSRLQLLTRLQSQRQQMAALHHGVYRAGGHHFHLHPRTDHPVHQPHVNHHAAIGIVLAVKNQRFERRVPVALGGRNIFHHIFQNRGDIDAHFCRNLRRVHGRQADDVLHLVLCLLGVCGGQVDLIDDRQNFKVVLHGEIGVGQCLSLHALRGIHHQHRPLAGGKGTGNLVVKVHMARRINEVQFVNLAVLRLVVQLHCPGLDGDAALPLQVHVVQQLAGHFSCGNGLTLFKQAVRQRGLAVVNMGDDGKVSDMRLIGHIEKTSLENSKEAG